MTELLAPASSDRVLEIGTGTGYQTAVLALLCRHVYTIERIVALHERAAAVLTDLNIKNVSLSVGDGSLGLPESAPFDRIIVTAAAPTVPKSLIGQLVDEGRLVIPVGSDREQTVVRVIRHGQRTIETPMLACRFVKLIGTEGWTPEEDFKT